MLLGPTSRAQNHEASAHQDGAGRHGFKGVPEMHPIAMQTLATITESPMWLKAVGHQASVNNNGSR